MRPLSIPRANRHITLSSHTRALSTFVISLTEQPYYNIILYTIHDRVYFEKLEVIII